MIIADVSSFFAAHAGGIRTYYHAKARWLPAAGHECHFIVPGARHAVKRFGGGWLHEIPGPPIGGGYRAFGDVAALRRLIRELAPDIVEVASHYVLPQLIAGASRTPTFIGFYHSDIPTTYVAPALTKLPRVQRLAVAAAWRWVRAQHARYAVTLAGSRQMVERLAHHGVPRVQWVGLGVELDDIVPTRRERTLRLGYAGRFARDKEIALVLAAAPAIERATGARIALAGDGPARAAVLRAAAAGHVDHAGALPRATVPTFLRAIDALIVPGRYESFSLIAAEAMAVGTPVIAADLGGAAELVRRSGGGSTFAAGDVDALVAAVRAFYALPQRMHHELGVAGRRHVVAEHAWPRVLERITRCYEEARCWS
jgi:alpha-1,6-mannosyltransferase